MTTPKTQSSMMTQEYHVLHEVAKALQTSQPTEIMLQNVLAILTQFEELKIEKKAGIFLVDEERKVLRLHTTLGTFTREFLDNEQEVPYGECLCGRVAASGDLLMSESCFTDPRHERTYSNMTAHGHYIVPLKSRGAMVGVMFLYTCTHPSWYRHSQEVLMSIGGLIADAILRSRHEQELARSHELLEKRVQQRTRELTEINQKLKVQIREHIKALQDLETTRLELRGLSHRLQSAREEEKTRIARQVHDELGQALTAIKLDLSWVARRLEEGDLPRVRDKIRSIGEFIDDSIERVREIASELRPPMLDLMGIAETLRWQARQFQNRTGIACEVVVEPDSLKLDAERSITLFRILQEALTNIVRHAGADSVQVRCERRAGRVELEVSDNGRGMAERVPDPPKSLGLVGMRERALAWGGEVHIQSAAGQGTTVTVSLPLEAKA